MNNIETGLVKIGLWAFGVMFTALFTMVTLTYQSQMATETMMRDFKAAQTQVNSYTVRRLSSDSIDINNLKTQVTILQYWVKKINPASFEEDLIINSKLEAVLPKKNYKPLNN